MKANRVNSHGFCTKFRVRRNIERSSTPPFEAVVPALSAAKSFAPSTSAAVGHSLPTERPSVFET